MIARHLVRRAAGRLLAATAFAVASATLSVAAPAEAPRTAPEAVGFSPSARADRRPAPGLRRPAVCGDSVRRLGGQERIASAVAPWGRTTSCAARGRDLAHLFDDEADHLGGSAHALRGGRIPAHGSDHRFFRVRGCSGLRRGRYRRRSPCRRLRSCSRTPPGVGGHPPSRRPDDSPGERIRVAGHGQLRCRWRASARRPSRRAVALQPRLRAARGAWSARPVLPEQFFAERIFEPLDMRDTFFRVPESKRDRLVRNTSGAQSTACSYRSMRDRFTSAPTGWASRAARVCSTIRTISVLRRCCAAAAN